MMPLEGRKGTGAIIGNTTLSERTPARFSEIRERIAKIPRVRLALTPTPLHDAPQLAEHLGGPRIFLERDDLTGAALGGNKTRNLEFRLAHALRDKPDVVIVGLDLLRGALSDHVGQQDELPISARPEPLPPALRSLRAGSTDLGSDMPNVERSCTYRQTLAYLRDYSDFLSDADRARIFRETTLSLFKA